MKRLIGILKGRHTRRVIIYFLVCCLVTNTFIPAALATPTGGLPDLSGGGGVTITYNTGTYGNPVPRCPNLVVYK